LPLASQNALTGQHFFPNLISGPFHRGLVLVFSVAVGLSVIACVASLLRGGRPAPLPLPLPDDGPAGPDADPSARQTRTAATSV
jgi:hypothetical protein